MRKGFLMVLAVALVAVLAAPAMAGTDINGFYRAKGYASNFKTGAPAAPLLVNDMNGNGYVEQRFRIRFSIGEENVKAVWFSEIDFSAWGDRAGSAPYQNNSNAYVYTAGSNLSYTNSASGYNPSGAQRNSGGALGGDAINLETKNVYVWFKVPDTSLDFTVGLQNQTDTFQGLIYGAADMAGIFATGKFEPISWKLGWAKLYENSTGNWDDVDLWAGIVNWAPTKELKLGFGLYFLNDESQKAGANSTSSTTALGPGYNPNTTLPFPDPIALDQNTKKIWTAGVDFAYNPGPVALSGFFLYQFGKIDYLVPPNEDVDVSAFAADLRADANLGPGKLFVEGLILSGGDGSGNKYQSVVTLSDVNASPGGNSAFTRMDYQILMGNADDINTNQCLIGCAASAASQRVPYLDNNATTTNINSRDANWGTPSLRGLDHQSASRGQSPGNFGRGIWTIGLGYTMKAAEKVTVKVGGGYLAAMKTLQSDTFNYPAMKKAMGTEVNANMNYNIMKGLDFGLYAAYAWVGDFFKGTVSSGGSANNDPDNLYDLHFRLNYAF